MEDEGGIPQLNQEELDELAATLDIQYAILDNLTGGHDTYTAAITIANKGRLFKVSNISKLVNLVHAIAISFRLIVATI